MKIGPARLHALQPKSWMCTPVATAAFAEPGNLIFDVTEDDIVDRYSDGYLLFCSKDLHTLVNVSIQEGGSSNAESKEEAFQYYQNILEILQKAPKVVLTSSTIKVKVIIVLMCHIKEGCLSSRINTETSLLTKF